MGNFCLVMVGLVISRAFYTLGCKLNFSETSGIAQNFEKGGFAKVEFEERPDVFVINTCSVTDNADKKM
jgi:threonylcarbamoyladenosine tRNA methylthiotransferase MtaB